MVKKLIVLLVVLCLVLASTACSKTADTSASTGWEPAENIQFNVQSGAGGGSDLMARAIAEKMTTLNIITKPIVVENITGAGGVNSFNETLKAAGSPYVWQTINSNFFTAPITGNIKTDYTGYTILAVIGSDPMILCTAADSPFNTLQDVVDACKADPKGISIMIGSAGSSGSIASVMFEDAAGIEMTQVPFEGGGDGLAAVMGKQVDLSWQNFGEVMGSVEGGLMKIIAVMGDERSKAAPDIPTFKEAGYDLVYEVPRAVAAPPDMPEEALTFYQDAFTKLDADPGWQKDYLGANYITHKFAIGDEAIAIIKASYDMTLDVYKQMGLAAPGL
ncbi:MAG TPA: tripartite tricarboxylate transporter substrate binding protein [Anaerovoracaceae bacterium]|nr:tripartite tricarboxylate transporter substrate binding protein [Anaerovoracaceae bacterium]